MDTFGRCMQSERFVLYLTPWAYCPEPAVLKPLPHHAAALLFTGQLGEHLRFVQGLTEEQMWEAWDLLVWRPRKRMVEKTQRCPETITTDNGYAKKLCKQKNAHSVCSDPSKRRLQSISGYQIRCTMNDGNACLPVYVRPRLVRRGSLAQAVPIWCGSTRKVAVLGKLLSPILCLILDYHDEVFARSSLARIEQMKCRNIDVGNM